MVSLICGHPRSLISLVVSLVFPPLPSAEMETDPGVNRRETNEQTNRSPPQLLVTNRVENWSWRLTVQIPVCHGWCQASLSPSAHPSRYFPSVWRLPFEGFFVGKFWLMRRQLLQTINVSSLPMMHALLSSWSGSQFSSLRVFLYLACILCGILTFSVSKCIAPLVIACYYFIICNFSITVFKLLVMFC